MSQPGEPPTPPAEGRTEPPAGWPQPTPPLGGTYRDADPWAAPPSPRPYAAWPPQGAPGDPAAAAALRTARTALGWAIGAAVAAGLAIVGMVVALVVGGLGVVGDGFYYEALRGEVAGLTEGSPLPAARLERPVVDLLREWSSDVDISCPDTPAVSVSTVVVCSGEVDGYEWTGVVVFEDSEGSFAVLEL